MTVSAISDQAAAYGLGNLPLFGNKPAAGNDQSQPAEETDPNSSAAQQDIIGILGSMNSQPPDRLN